MVFYAHLRYTVSADQSDKIAKEFVKKFKPNVYIFAKEVSEKGVQHTHAHLEYDAEPKKQTRCDFFKKHNLSGKYDHGELKKDPIHNKLYVFKDLDVFYHNLSEEAFEELEQKTVEINSDKKKDIKIKLIDEVKPMVASFNKTVKLHSEDGDIDQIKNYMSLRDIARIIKDTYINKYDKLPPTKSLMFQYSIYVAQKLEICQEEIDQIYDNIF